MSRKSRILTGALSLCAALAGPVAAEEPDWRDYARLLQSHLTPGERHQIRLMTVDYEALRNDPLYTRVVTQIANFSPARLADRGERLAFYINAYNILTIKMVVDNWPMESIKDAGNWFRPVWKKTAGLIGGVTVTLDQIEHEILRPMGEPRVHMAIVCASVSCPDLRQEAYTAKRIDQQLDEQTRSFLHNPTKGLYLEGSVVHVSKVFDWFEEDFARVGGVEGFIRKYRPNLPLTLDVEADIPYDWSLNRP